MRRRILVCLALVLLLVAAVFLTSDSPRIWPYRNVLQYTLLTSFGSSNEAESENAERPPTALTLANSLPTGTISGIVSSSWGRPVEGATVLVAARDGTAFSVESDIQGRYTITNVPTGSYIPVAGAPGFDDTAVRTWLGIRVHQQQVTPLNITLRPRTAVRVTPADNLTIGESQVWQIEKPLPARAVRREISYTVEGRPSQPTFFYTPDDQQETLLPTLLAVYPGPADQWESVSLPLAQAGFAVIAVGPAYALDLEADVDDLYRLIAFAKSSGLPRADAAHIGALGGSYSSLHVLRLAVREPQLLEAALLLGPPTDMFELRRQFEAGTFFPPFGLDQALIALGLPSREPERYWRYSARYHARDLQLPLMLIHSKADEVVPFTQSEILAAELARLGKPHELHILEEMGHYLLATERTPAIENLFQTTIDFFRQELSINGE